MAGMKAYDEYINGGNTKGSQMPYADYLDYWMIDKILLRFNRNNTFICAFLTACYTGMRTGEVFVLNWNDIDLENKIIKINKTVYSKIKDDKGKWYLGTTKTKGSSREVFICDTLYKVL